MEILFEQYGANRFFLPQGNIEVQYGMRGGAVFFECEPMNVTSHLIGSRNGAAYRNSVFKNARQRQIAHYFIRKHVPGRGDPLVV